MTAIAFLRCLILLWILDRVTQLYTQAQGTHFSLLYDTHELHLDYNYAPVAKRSFLKNALPNKDFCSLHISPDVSYMRCRHWQLHRHITNRCVIVVGLIVFSSIL